MAMEPWPIEVCASSAPLIAAAASAPPARRTSFLLLGPSQSGKSSLAASFARALPCPLLLVTAGGLHHRHPGALLWRGVLEAFTDGAAAALCSARRAAVLLFDDVDVLFPAGGGPADPSALRAFALGLRRAAALPVDGGATLWVFGAARGGVHEWAAACLRGGAAPLLLGAPPPTLRGRMLVAALRCAGLPVREGVDAEAVAALGAALGHGFFAGDVAAVAARAAEGAGGPADAGGGGPPPCSGEALRARIEAALRTHAPLLLASGGAEWGAPGGAPAPPLGPAGGDRGNGLRRALLAAGLTLPGALAGVEDFRPRALLEFRGGAVTVALRRGGSGDGGAPPAPRRAPGSGSAALALGPFPAAARPTSPPCSWDSVVGQAAAKRALRALLGASASAVAPGAARAAPAPSGILLYGPPGTGKTLLARAAAGALGCRFINVTIPSVLKAGLGESEAALGAAFAMARLAAPSLIFIDEVQALFTARGGGGSGDDDAEKLAAALTAALLHCLDGAAAAGGVVVLAATNAPAALDDALFRPGRMDRVVHVGLPCEEDRFALLRQLLAPLALAKGAPGSAAPPLAQLAALLEDLAGRATASKAGATVEKEEEEEEREGDATEGDAVEGDAGGGALPPLILCPEHFVAALRGDPSAGLAPMEPSVPPLLAISLASWRPRRQQQSTA
jgi:AAA+ superfamily predicted ATPase